MKSKLMLGVNPKAERQQEDFYATDPKALELFLDKLKQDKIYLFNVWECACGQGHLAEVLKKQPFVTYDTNNTAEVLLPRISMIIKNVKRNLNTDEIEVY